MHLALALIALVSFAQGARFVYRWARPKGALYPAEHFLGPALTCFAGAGLCAYAAVTWR